MSDKLKYPLILVHGMGFRDFGCVNYWGRIPRVLSKCGATVYYGNQDSNGDIETNALQLASQIDRIFFSTKAEKINIIGHSK